MPTLPYPPASSLPIRQISIILLALCTLAVAPIVTAQDKDRDAPGDPATTPQTGRQAEDNRIDFATIDPVEAKILEGMLGSTDWAYRALGLMRLDRFTGEAVDELLDTALGDESWQVRCFAIEQAWKQGRPLTDLVFTETDDPRVLRTAVQHGAQVPDEIIDPLVSRLLGTRTVDALLMGIELGAASEDEGIRSIASQRALTLIRNMNPSVAAVVSRRLAQVLQLNPAPTDVVQWRQWVSAQPRTWLLPRTQPRARSVFDSATLITQAESETFSRLRDYMGVLRQRDLELVITMDATTSMAPMIDAVRADVDALILFLSDISSTLRLGICAYRDHDNPGRLVEAHPFSTDLESLRNFLFGLSTPGGQTYPEAVLAGIEGCRQFDWHREAEREIILIGDAPPHDHEASELRRRLEWFRGEGFVVHAVHVPMVWSRNDPRSSDRQQEQWRQDYNTSTQIVFQEIANFGGGRLVQMNTNANNDLVRNIMKLTIEQEWWDYFDEFYDAYLELCR